MPITISGSTGIAGVDGSASTPAVQGTDTNTGIAFPAADTVAVATGGTERMRVDSSGNVGIGTSSPGAKLEISAQNALRATGFQPFQDWRDSNDSNKGYRLQTAGGNMLFSIDATGGGTYTERMRIDSSGNVGIGTGSPATKLDVNGNLAVRGGPFSEGGEIQLYNPDTTTVGAILDVSAADNTRWFTTRNNTTHSIGQLGGTGGIILLYTAGSERARITSGGAFCVGTTNVLPGYLNAVTGVALQGDGTSCFSKSGNITTVINNNGSGQVLTQYFYQGSYVGQVILNGTTGVLYQTASDYRLKQNVQPLTGSLATIAALKPSTYRWKADNSHGEGFLAHELAAHIPQAVTGEKDAVDEDGRIKPQSVDYSKIVVHLVAAIQELKAENDDLKARLTALEAK